MLFDVTGLLLPPPASPVPRDQGFTQRRDTVAYAGVYLKMGLETNSRQTSSEATAVGQIHEGRI